ncbi:MAG: SAM-dependent methyltransferase, partial [Clostridia bacterium]|nr:SAM-dependent methyltransferase [Clostridia bacterium]
QSETLRIADVADTEVNSKHPVQASQENIRLSDAPARLATWIDGFDQINVMTTIGNCEFRRSKGGKETLLGANNIRRALDGSPVGGNSPIKIIIGGNDKAKRRILTGAEPFLIELDVSDQNGRVHDKKQAKYRQINRFLELIRDVENHLPTEGVLNIADLCCGKSYLSFAVYHYFTAIRGRSVRMVGVDMKAEVMNECNTIARNLGMDGLTFVCGDVTQYEFPEGAQVHMVISLHACDIATDIVLDKATEWGAKVILSTPCCHHDLNRRLNSPSLSFVAQHSMLRQKLCDAATDALRLKKLEANGYDVTALELIDPEETPKNIMLRGIRKYSPDSARCKKAAEEYAAAYEFLTGETIEL